MNLEYVLLAACCFIFYAMGRIAGIRHGFKLGKEALGKAMEKDMRDYPTKWKRYIDKVGKDDT